MRRHDSFKEWTPLWKDLIDVNLNNDQGEVAVSYK